MHCSGPNTASREDSIAVVPCQYKWRGLEWRAKSQYVKELCMATKKSAKATRKSTASKTTAKKMRAATKKTHAAKQPERGRAAKKPAPRAQSPLERFGLIEVGGRPATVIGTDVMVGQTAPAFTAQVGAWAGLDLWQAVAPLTATAGQVRILAAVPSLDTNTCNIETRRFNEEAAALADDIVIITV